MKPHEQIRAGLDPALANYRNRTPDRTAGVGPSIYAAPTPRERRQWARERALAAWRCWSCQGSESVASGRLGRFCATCGAEVRL